MMTRAAPGRLTETTASARAIDDHSTTAEGAPEAAAPALALVGRASAWSVAGVCLRRSRALVQTSSSDSASAGGHAPSGRCDSC